ncbi:hypothetical protein AOLI_G00165530 [Acnodon oligacanthus]
MLIICGRQFKNSPQGTLSQQDLEILDGQAEKSPEEAAPWRRLGNLSNQASAGNLWEENCRLHNRIQDVRASGSREHLCRTKDGLSAMAACPGTRCHHFPASDPAVPHSAPPALQPSTVFQKVTLSPGYKRALYPVINDGQTNVLGNEFIIVAPA